MRFIILKTNLILEKVPVAPGASSGKGDASLKGGRVLQVDSSSELLKEIIDKDQEKSKTPTTVTVALFAQIPAEQISQICGASDTKKKKVGTK